MTQREEWGEVAGRIRADGDPLQSEHLARLYELAERDGPKVLHSFERKLGRERVRDLVFDLLIGKLDALLEAENPWAFFVTVLRRDTISWLRRGDAAVAESPGDDAPAATAPTTAAGEEDERRAFVIDAREALSQLSQRDCDIVLSVYQGEDREDVARRHRTSRANVDQIISRLQRRFRESRT